MTALLTHLTAVERLAAHGNELPPEFSRALGSDLEYARFGAALPWLPHFGGLALGLDAWFQKGGEHRCSYLMTRKAPVHFGLKAAELVANGALVGVDAGLAFLAGYFTQLCVSRALDPLVSGLVAAQRGPGESDGAAKARIEWTQSLFLMAELHGSTMVGTPAVRRKLQLRKGTGFRRIGRGMYELVRVSSLEAFNEAPSKEDVDSWIRGLHLFSLALGSPLGKLKAKAAERPEAKALYRGTGVDVFAAVESGLDNARVLLAMLGGLVRRNTWSTRARNRFLDVCPEPSHLVFPAPRPSPELDHEDVDDDGHAEPAAS